MDSLLFFYIFFSTFHGGELVCLYSIVHYRDGWIGVEGKGLGMGATGGCMFA